MNRHLLVLLLLAVVAAPARSQNVTLPDTGLFAPVAAQLAARTQRLAAAQGAERIRLLIDTGRPARSGTIRSGSIPSASYTVQQRSAGLTGRSFTYAAWASDAP